jgi:hypothetical protein
MLLRLLEVPELLGIASGVGARGLIHLCKLLGPVFVLGVNLETSISESWPLTTRANGSFAIKRSVVF